MSENEDQDTLEVYFWGVDWFTSGDGEPVRYGTRLDTPIVRQLDPDVAQTLDDLSKIVRILTLGAILLSIIASGGNLLPTWIFLHALQTMSHVPLFQSQMPPNASFFMAKFLDICRFDPLIMWTIDKPEFLDKYGLLGDGALNVNFKAFGYHSVHLIDNMTAVLVICLLIIAVSFLCLVKQMAIALARRIKPDSVKDIGLVKNQT